MFSFYQICRSMLRQKRLITRFNRRSTSSQTSQTIKRFTAVKRKIVLRMCHCWIPRLSACIVSILICNWCMIRFSRNQKYLHVPPVLPETLKIRIEPKALVAGTEATLYCDSSSSNPPVKLSWYRDGIPLMSESGVINQPGLWGGKISSTQVRLNITQVSTIFY